MPTTNVQKVSWVVNVIGEYREFHNPNQELAANG